MRNAAPSSALIAAPTATSFFDDDDDAKFWIEGQFDGEGDAADDIFGVAVTAVVSVLLGDVEPDVRLKITCPAGIQNGAVLSLVAVMHVPLE